jgi:hypothetical protein
VVDGERRSLWHDPLTNEQWFGLNADDPTPSSRTAVVPVDGQPVARPVDVVHLLVDAGDGGTATGDVRWET